MKTKTMEKENHIKLPEEIEEARNFRLNVNNGEFFNNDYVLKIRLPQFGLLNHVESQQIMDGSSIVVTLSHGPNVAKNLIQAIQKTLENFNIEFVMNNEVYCVWTLHDATITGVSFGEISKVGYENPNFALIECEICFKSLEIDGVIV